MTLIVPSYEELKKEFDWVDDGFRKAEAKDWQLHISCKDTPLADPDVCELIHFGETVSTEEAISRILSRGFRPPTLADFLAWSRKNRNFPDEFPPILCLGATCLWGGRRDTPCLLWTGSKWALDLWWLSGWIRRIRFLVVRV